MPSANRRDSDQVQLSEFGGADFISGGRMALRCRRISRTWQRTRIWRRSSTEERAGESVAQANGFSLHAGIAAEAEQRQKLERLCRYIARPAVAIERLSRTAQGTIRYALKTPYRDGTTHVIFEPLDFLARLASLVPSPRVNLTRFHGCFAPHHRLRAQIVPGKRGRRAGQTSAGPTQAAGEGEKAPLPRHVAMTWAQRLARVFKIDVTVCERCGGAVKIIAFRTRSSPARFSSTWSVRARRSSSSH